MRKNEKKNADADFVNYLPAMPDLSKDSRTGRLFSRLFGRRGSN